MFRNFDWENDNKIVNCNESNSLKHIIYIGGNNHVLNIVNFFNSIGIKSKYKEDFNKERPIIQSIDLDLDILNEFVYPGKINIL